MSVTLKNKTKRPLVYDLKHDDFRELPAPFGYQRFAGEFTSESSDGTRRSREVRMGVPSSITIQPGQELSGVPPAVKKVEAVLRDWTAGDLLIDGKTLAQTNAVTPAAEEEPSETHAHAHAKAVSHGEGHKTHKKGDK